MIWFLIEAGVAGALLIFIVLWTLPKKRKEPQKEVPHESKPETSAHHPAKPGAR